MQQKDEFWRYCVVYGKILFQVEGGSVVFGMIGRLNTDGIPLLQFEFEFAGNGQDQLKGIEAITSLPWGYEVPDLVEMQAQKLGYQRTEEEVGYKVVGLINFEDGWPFFWHEGYERTERLNPKADLKDGMYKTRILTVWWGAVTFSGYLSAPFGVLALVDNPIVNTQGFVFDVLDIEDGDVNVSVGTCYFNFQQQFPYGNYKMELR